MSDTSITPTPKNVKPTLQERFEITLTTVYVTVRWWPWGPMSASYTINKRADFDDPDQILPAEILGGPAWQQPRSAEWVRDVADKMYLAATIAEELDAMVITCQDFLSIEVLETVDEDPWERPGIEYIQLYNPEHTERHFYSPMGSTTVTDERKPQEARDE